MGKLSARRSLPQQMMEVSDRYGRTTTYIEENRSAPVATGFEHRSYNPQTRELSITKGVRVEQVSHAKGIGSGHYTLNHIFTSQVAHRDSTHSE